MTDLIQGPHCLMDFELTPELRRRINTDFILDLVLKLSELLKMKRKNDPRIIRGRECVSVYQIISTSHIILHFTEENLRADLFSCEPFDVDICMRHMSDIFGDRGDIQYCQRNLFSSPSYSKIIPMAGMNSFTGNKNTFTHTMVNWYGGREKLLCDIEHGTQVLNRCLPALNIEKDLPPSGVLLLDVAPVKGSWDKGGFSGGYINILSQLTLHTFAGVNGAYMDIMSHTYDLERILQITKKGFEFLYYEIDAVFQRGTCSPGRA